MARIISALGSAYRHDILALDGAVTAKYAIAADINCGFIDWPELRGNLMSRLLRIGVELRHRRPELLLTYNWGAIEWAMANRLLSHVPHIHHEAGFGKEEAEHQLARRVRFRRWALHSTQQIIVPSRTLEQIALEIWQLHEKCVLYLPNGIDDQRFASLRTRSPPQGPDNLVTIGSLAPLRPEKNIGRLLRAIAIARQTTPLRVAIAGEGSERPQLGRLARELGIAEAVEFLGVVEPEALLSKIDILALSSDTEQMPNAVLEAMAAALPVVSPDVGDVRIMVAPENVRFIVPRGDEVALSRALLELAREPELRRSIGVANLLHVQEEFSYSAMISRWGSAFADAIGRSRSTG